MHLIALIFDTKLTPHAAVCPVKFGLGEEWGELVYKQCMKYVNIGSSNSHDHSLDNTVRSRICFQNLRLKKQETIHFTE
jgi:hypothetical protein